MDNLEKLVRQLVQYPHETPWIEFKENLKDPQEIGEYISALANSAAYCDKDYAYLIWGVHDQTHEITETVFDWHMPAKGNQALELWLRTMLSANADFTFDSCKVDGKRVVVMTVPRAMSRTVMFQKTEYIRVGSHKKKLNDVPSMQAQLWERIRNMNFEQLPAKENLTLHDALQLIDYNAYYTLQRTAIPNSVETIAQHLCEDFLLIHQDDGCYTVTNMGAILLAKRLNQFPTVSRKAMRIVQFRGNNKMEMIRETSIETGYAVGYREMLQYIEALLPAREQIIDGIRSTRLALPLKAIDEAVANALIHQDFSLRGTGPLIEIFDGRIEITNPGIPLIDVFRIVDNPPRSRNEKTAALMRRFHICEESGSGWDKIIISSELECLPAPKISVYEESMKVTLLGHIPFSEIAQEDKLWACYLHACIFFVEGKQINNTTLRKRFDLPDTAASQVSRLIKMAVAQKLIKPFDPDTAPRYMRYVPIWA